MRVAITGGTGFLGRYIVRQLVRDGHACRLWCRRGSDRGGMEDVDSHVEWIDGQLGDASSAARLVQTSDAVVHAALDRPGGTFRGGEGDIVAFVEKNLVGTLQLIEEARAAGAAQFIYISTCAVHERILDDRPLDETHPLWPASHYGAHKAAVEAFVHSYGFGHKYNICALRPTGIYGLAHRVEQSKWYGLIRDVLLGKEVTCRSGGKEVHAQDVAESVAVLLRTPGIAGQSYACYDQYISEYDVAVLAQKISGSHARIHGQPSQPKHQIVADKIKALGVSFGGPTLLQKTVEQIVRQIERGPGNLNTPQQDAC